MAPSERKEPDFGAPKPGPGSDGHDDDFLDLIPERLAPRAGGHDEPDEDLHAAPDDDAFAADPAPAAAAPRSRLSADPEPEEDEDDYDDEPEERSGSSRGVMAAVVVGAVAAGIAGWYLFLREEPVQTAAEMPVIASDGQPYKVRPADPGGMQVPNTDKMVYDRLGQNTGQDSSVENLLAEPAAPSAPPPPSEPMAEAPPAAMPPVPEEEVAAVPTPQPVPAAPAAPSAPAAPAPVVEAPAPVPTPAPAPKPQVAAVPPAPAPAAPAPAAPAPTVTAPAGGGSQMVQLAALKDEASARTAWDRVVASNRDLLGNLNLDIQRADLGAKGVFYRVRAKGLRSADEAKALCDKLAARKVGCIVVR